MWNKEEINQLYEVMTGMDSVMGEGASKYIGEAIEAFYSSREE